MSASSGGPGQGSESSVSLPRKTAPVREGANLPDPPPGQTRGGVRVLIVDDNEDAAFLLADCLQSAGHDTRVAHDGPSAIRVAADFKPQIGLFDIGLPVMDGYELAHRFHEDPILRRVRLIAVTGYGQENDRARSAEAGFHAHIVKPVDIYQLGQLVASLAAESQSDP